MPPNSKLPSHIYYYDYSKEDFLNLANISYKEALLAKVNAGKGLLRRLLHKPFQSQDTSRINDVIKAINFNKELLKELE